jgi:hypothetical protein
VVHITTGTDMTPSTQYCYIYLDGPNPWCGGAQSFGRGSTQLTFSGFPEFDSRYELFAGISPNQAVAQGCDRGLSERVSKRYNSVADTIACVCVHYDCMQSYDIRYGDDLQNRLNQAFGRVNPRNELVLIPDGTSLPDTTLVNQGELVNWAGLNWFLAFQAGDPGDIYIAGIEDLNRTGFYPNGDNLDSTIVGLTLPYIGGIGDRGSWSLVLKDFIAERLQTDDLEEGCLRCSTHEMGHARAGLSDADDPESAHLHTLDFKCVMSALRVDAGTGRLVSGYQYYCPACLQNIAGSSWP